ncbi:MAG: hypothetical protein AAGI13_00890 [Pseudomonadota bacterium]
MTSLLWSPAQDAPAEAGLMARAFGSRGEDLAVDLAVPLQVAITRLLSTCIEGVGAGEAECWSFAKRRQGLLAIAVATHGPMREVTVTCPDPECGARLDLALDLRDFVQDWRRDRVQLPGGAVLRLPGLADLSGPEDHLLERLLEGDPPKGDWQGEAEEALAEADPLGDMILEARCPECGGPVSHAHAFEPGLVAELAGEAQALMDEIHVLAMAYHWSETEILALPTARRRHYLERIREAWAA